MQRIIATWMMSITGMDQIYKGRKNNNSASDIVETIIKEVEDFPYYKSVGYGGLPNEEGIVELDAGFMEASTMKVGAVCAIKDFKNPISIARKLADENYNNILVGKGAQNYALKHGFEQKNMLTSRAKEYYNRKIKQYNSPKVYRGHDTVGVCCLDNYNNLSVGTSTSGLFLKKPGRIGDSPIIGSGFYADNDVAAVTATGVGEVILKGLVSYEIVRKIKDGMDIQSSCELTLIEVENKLKAHGQQIGDISIVGVDKYGNYGVCTNIKNFSFVTMNDFDKPVVYICNRKDKTMEIKKADKKFMDDYMNKRLKERIE
ncbi:MAG: isoaspartyl peptidase/L-asparaginase [Tissierellia bacterium]|nr:isoaspartyl peptidase/L-asparaginase [Tissierellia bacterium]